MTDRLPPQSIEAEQAVLGAMLLSRDAIDTVINTKLQTKDFYIPQHRLIYQAIIKLYNNNKPADILTVAEELSGADVDRLYMTGLTEAAPSIANTYHYAAIVVEKAILNRIISIGHSAVDQAYDIGADGNALLESLEQQIYSLKTSENNGTQTITEVLPDALKCIEAMASGEITGLPTPWEPLNKLTRGFQNTDVIIVAADTSVGKTTLVLNIAEKLILEDIPVHIFSLEMSIRQLGQRLICSNARVDPFAERHSDSDWKCLSDASGRLYDKPLYITDNASLTPLAIRSEARRIKLKYNTQLIIIDYAQLIRFEGAENRTQQLEIISGTFKIIAKELNVPIIVLSQLKRQREGRPCLTDLKGSGSFEQDASVVIFIHRERDKNKIYEPSAEIIIAKQRMGPTGVIGLYFNKAYARFDLQEYHRKDGF